MGRAHTYGILGCRHHTMKEYQPPGEWEWDAEGFEVGVACGGMAAGSRGAVVAAACCDVCYVCYGRSWAKGEFLASELVTEAGGGC